MFFYLVTFIAVPNINVRIIDVFLIFILAVLLSALKKEGIAYSPRM